MAAAFDVEQELAPLAVGQVADEVGARVHLTGHGGQPMPVRRDLRKHTVGLADGDGLGLSDPLVAQPVEEQLLVSVDPVRRMAGVVVETLAVGHPGHGRHRGEGDPLGEHLSRFGLDHVKHALLVAAERNAEGDMATVGGGVEPVKRDGTVVAGEGRRVDQDATGLGRAGGHLDRGAPIVEPHPKPVLATVKRCKDELHADVRSDQLPQAIQVGPGAQVVDGAGGLPGLPGQDLRGVLLQPRIWVFERDAADGPGDRTPRRLRGHRSTISRPSDAHR